MEDIYLISRTRGGATISLAKMDHQGKRNQRATPNAENHLLLDVAVTIGGIKIFVEYQ